MGLTGDYIVFLDIMEKGRIVPMESSETSAEFENAFCATKLPENMILGIGSPFQLEENGTTGAFTEQDKISAIAEAFDKESLGYRKPIRPQNNQIAGNSRNPDS